MADFSDGVKEYIEGVAIIKNHFPVDLKGNADISCHQCRYFSRNNGVCQITKEVTPYPQKHVGYACPFKKNEEENNG